MCLYMDPILRLAVITAKVEKRGNYTAEGFKSYEITDTRIVKPADSRDFTNTLTLSIQEERKVYSVLN
ncbi:hypothetical protein Y032_0004g1956 [Ancylostoma ceylanicum]|uniref:Uncharacterized protein n=1 Tax=Ancylostoma ceylanicum TaxID=53326 RepID=A0A016VU47_9BILA|nr:hypothetical protein Y032_0004g1956 [Ancylostoma ceylanicum]